jgi:hypothetical protein
VSGGGGDSGGRSRSHKRLDRSVESERERYNRERERDWERPDRMAAALWDNPDELAAVAAAKKPRKVRGAEGQQARRRGKKMRGLGRKINLAESAMCNGLNKMEKELKMRGLERKINLDCGEED